MFKFETENPRRNLFASKGEAIPTPAVEVGIMARAGEDSIDEVGGRGPELAEAAGLSSLIMRKKQYVRVTAPNYFRDQAPEYFRDQEDFSKPIWPPVPKKDEAGAGVLATAKAAERHAFTVRLEEPDYRELMACSVTMERTYQDILATAVSKYLADISRQESNT